MFESPVKETPSSMAFEELYLGTRRGLLLQAYALTGDLDASRRAVREAFVAARHHWRRIARMPRPEEWIRPRAWSMAQRRHLPRLWHHEKGLTADERAVLDALHELPDQQRKTLLLAELAGCSELEIARELGLAPDAAEELLTRARRVYARLTGCETDAIRQSLETLSPVVASVALPGPDLMERHGRSRRRSFTTVGVVGLVGTALLGGWLVSGTGAGPGAGTDRPAEPPEPLTETMLLSVEQVDRLAPRQSWRHVSTGDNTQGSGINSVCQDSRFADPAGLAAFVRRFRAEGSPRRTLVQTVELSSSPAAAVAAFQSTLGWFAGCEEARLQLLNAYRLARVGDEGRMLTLRIPEQVRRTYVVGVVRTGQLTVSLVALTLNGRPPEVRDAAGVLTRAVRDLCDSPAAGACPRRPKVVPVLPPPSGEEPGTLAAADLPAVGKINKPWRGTDASPARTNLAATTCDETSFVKAGAANALSRTFLVPGAKVPRTFGITETVGTFGNVPKARALVRTIVDDMTGCEDEDPGATIATTLVQPDGYRGSEYALWRLDSEISEDRTVSFWMGVARVGRHVAQVTFTPSGEYDVDEETFRAMVTRARDRLFELGKRGRP